MPRIKRISEFTGAYRFLSNFWPVIIDLDENLYTSVEHAYQASKTDDPGLRQVIKNQPSPGRAKRLGGSIPLRPGWDSLRLNVMELLVRQKFSREPLKSKLLATGSTMLIEGNRWGDTFWGICRGKGENYLGRILMRIRDEIRTREELILKAREKTALDKASGICYNVYIIESGG